MIERLEELSRQEREIRVVLVGAGAMGVGIAAQISRTPGMRLVAICDVDLEAARVAADAACRPAVIAQPGAALPRTDDIILTRDPFPLFALGNDLQVDVLSEATNTVGFAGRLSLAAIAKGAHVVLMNAEVDLALGPLLQTAAVEKGVIVTSDAGDQPGVIMGLIEEVRLWGLDVVMAGNIKGFLDRRATPESIAYEAQIRNLDPRQCCAYTDGTKLNIEMALVANGTGFLPFVRGMEGPRAQHIHEVLELFDFDRYQGSGVVDYILGAEPGGGVFVVARSDDPLQARYLQYYKLGGGPYYLFYRPYHLCSFETGRAIASACLYGKPILRPSFGRVADVYTYAKRDLEPGETIENAIGCEQVYGLIEKATEADAEGRVPIAILEGENGRSPRLTRRLRMDEAVRYDDLELPETFLLSSFRRQLAMLADRRDAEGPHG
jgi:predicted homoserine dehydrogenase-like protein